MIIALADAKLYLAKKKAMHNMTRFLSVQSLEPGRTLIFIQENKYCTVAFLPFNALLKDICAPAFRHRI